MPRYIPIQLQDDLDTGITTLTACVRIDPVTPGFDSYGITTSDRDIPYSGVGGELLYLAAIGGIPSTIMATGDLSVDNAEGAHLIPEYDVPISEVDIRAGAYDFARFTCFLLNYEDPSKGHITLLKGTIGQVSIRADGLSFINEYRSLAAQLKQSVCEKDSLTCRAIFGSQPEGSPIPGPTERFPCGYPAETLLVETEVIAVSLEPNITFTVEADTNWYEDSFAPGIVKFLTGLNAGRTYEISANSASGEITLSFDTPFPVEVGDELVYRRDCIKHARDTEKGCMSHWGDEWVLHFRGEPDIPIGDAGAMQTPGASGTPGQGSPRSEPLDPE